MLSRMTRFGELPYRRSGGLAVPRRVSAQSDLGYDSFANPTGDLNRHNGTACAKAFGLLAKTPEVCYQSTVHSLTELPYPS